MSASHRVKFPENPDDLKEAIQEALRIYNLTDNLQNVYRLVKPNEILPPEAVSEKLKDGREVVQILSVDGKEAALQSMINKELEEQGPVCHFVGGWLAAKGFVEEIPPEERKELEEAAQGRPQSLLERMKKKRGE